MKVDTALSLELDPSDSAVEAEKQGYDAAWVGEVNADPFIALALAAVHTNTVQLGTSIALAFARNPMSLAISAHHVQILSEGRLVLGLGSQIKAHITRRFSMEWSRPAARLREYVLALRAIWASWNDGVPLDFRGEFYTHTLMPPFFQPPASPSGAPPVYLAAVGAEMTAVAGEVADGMLLHGFTTEKYVREVTLPALRRGRQRAEGAQREFAIAALPIVVTGGNDVDLAAARSSVCAQIAFYGSTPAYHGVLEVHGWKGLGEKLHTMSRQGQWQEMAEAIDDDVLNAFAVVAPPEQVAAKLIERYGDIVARMVLYLPYNLDQDIRRSIEAELRGHESRNSTSADDFETR